MDDGLWILLALGGVAFVFLGPIGFFLTLGARRRLQIAEGKIRALEARLPVVQDQPSTVPATQMGEAPSAQPVQADDKPWGGWEVARANDSIGVAQSPALHGQQTEPVEPSPLFTRRSRRSLEEALGAHWAVYVGGVALALGGLLLVRYSIEQGWFGPGARVALGFLFAFMLVTAGEFLRRREKTAGVMALAAGEPVNSTLTPAVLTAAGTVSGFGAIYAAHALYHFIGPTIAFVALGTAGLAAMSAAALHGPALAGIGLAGALATPLLVQSDTHDAWPAVIYLAIVTAATYGLARLRTWLWLAIAGAAGAILWGFILSLGGMESAHANYVYIVIQTALACLVFTFDHRIVGQEQEAKLGMVPTLGPLAFGWLTVVVQLSGAQFGAFDLAWILSGAVVVAIFSVTGVLALSAAGVIAGAGILVLAILWIWPGDAVGPEAVKLAQDVLWVWFMPLEPRRFYIFAALGSGLVAWLSGITLYRGPNLSSPIALVYAGTATLTPLAALALAYLRLTHSDASLQFGVIAGVLAVVFLLAAIAFRQRLSEATQQALHLGLGAMASAALAALALGVVFVLDRGMLTVALALAALGAAIVESRLSIPALRWAVAGLGLVVAGRLAYEPRIVGADLGATPIFNWLLFGYGVPAVAFGLAARVMRRASGEDLPIQIAQALSVIFSALLFFFEIRHALNRGDPYAKGTGLIEQGLFATTSLVFSLALTRLDTMRASPVFRFASLAFGVISALVSFVGLGVIENPYFSGKAIEGGLFFNAILLSYGLPAVLAVVLARMANGVRPRWFVVGARIVALALVFLLVTLETRRFFETDLIGWKNRASEAENYAYSAVWLVLGIVLLAFGLWRASRELRVASGLFVVAAVLKVFLYDLAQLQGILRALSFIGLGAVLIGIGLVYQKLIFPRSSQT
jgi:uncharacterized membrane protein